mgnify:CR=1 FL=1
MWEAISRSVASEPGLEFILLAGMTLFLTGCKLAVIVVEGSQFQSGFGTCPDSGICIIEDLPGENTAEQFTAMPDPGWFFINGVFWRPIHSAEIASDQAKLN